MNLKKLKLPNRYNYIACFLTLDCNLNCEYCINNFGNNKLIKHRVLTGKDWVRGLDRLVSRDDLPVTFQGGEPALHPDCIWILKNIRGGLNIDILTNLTFDADEFIREINPLRFKRDAPYAAIRVSYHPFHMELDALIRRVLKLQKAGFSIGIYGILHPQFTKDILTAQKRCLEAGIDFRTKEFLGEFEGKLYGSYKYPEAVGSTKKKKSFCRNSELIIGPDGSIYRCHHDLYKDFPPIGNLLDADFKIEDIFRTCDQYGDCNPCDIKVKTNRFQIHGHTSVEIKEIEEII